MSGATTWTVLNEGSFASVKVRLPPRACAYCETDAVVTMSEGCDVQGIMQGGLLGSLARQFLTRESFFTTCVENTSPSSEGDVLFAPSDPGGIALHRLTSPMLLAPGAYLASDDGIKVTSEVQSNFGNSMTSGTGFFLLRAQGHGTLALAAYGSIIKYELRTNERRLVDNGHLVAWTASMRYNTCLASRRQGLFGSLTSGEGIMCQFEGPGTVYVQTHKPPNGANGSRSERNKQQGSSIVCFLFVFLIIFMVFVLQLFASSSSQFSMSYDTPNGNRHYTKRQRADLGLREF